MWNMTCISWHIYCWVVQHWKIIKISQHLSKLWVNIDLHVFMAHGVHAVTVNRHWLTWWQVNGAISWLSENSCISIVPSFCRRTISYLPESIYRFTLTLPPIKVEDKCFQARPAPSRSMLPPDNDMMWILDFPLPQLLPVSFKNLIITIAVIVVVMLLIKKVTNTQATKKRYLAGCPGRGKGRWNMKVADKIYITTSDNAAAGNLFTNVTAISSHTSGRQFIRVYCR